MGRGPKSTTSRIKPLELKDRLSPLAIIPIVALDEPGTILPLAEALASGGLPLVEITFRTRVAAEAIRLLARERPDMLIGAGTVLTVDTLAQARDAGARFAVAPGLNPKVVRAAKRMGMPFIPGVATPSEVEQAVSLECELLKFFPAEALGGVAMLAALYAPYAHLGLGFIPTGGVNESNLETYLRSDAVIAVGGTWLAPKADLAAGKWEQICQRCREAVKKVGQFRDVKDTYDTESGRV